MVDVYKKTPLGIFVNRNQQTICFPLFVTKITTSRHYSAKQSVGVHYVSVLWGSRLENQCPAEHFLFHAGYEQFSQSLASKILRKLYITEGHVWNIWNILMIRHTLQDKSTISQWLHSPLSHQHKTVALVLVKIKLVRLF